MSVGCSLGSARLGFKRRETNNSLKCDSSIRLDTLTSFPLCFLTHGCCMILDVCRLLALASLPTLANEDELSAHSFLTNDFLLDRVQIASWCLSSQPRRWSDVAWQQNCVPGSNKPRLKRLHTFKLTALVSTFIILQSSIDLFASLFTVF